jgi:phosphoribosylaminoimidazole carboxylase PurE protein
MIQVAIIMGSASDQDVIARASRMLDYFGISYEVTILSAHRNPDRLESYIREAEKNGARVIIAAAGLAAHLAGAVAARTVLPVIGVPLAAGDLHGMDALLSTVQMPSGIPVATMAIGKAGAENAAVMAARILALTQPELKNKLDEYMKHGCRVDSK